MQLTEEQQKKLDGLRRAVAQTHDGVSKYSGKGPELKHRVAHDNLYKYGLELGIVTKRSPKGDYFWIGGH